MGPFKSAIYFCSECKNLVNHLDDLLFIDEKSHKGFCSETCIEDFYLPFIKHFAKLASELREKYDLLNEDSEHFDIFLTDSEQERVIKNPSEVYCQQNELGDSFYFFISHFIDHSAVVISTAYEKEASFIFFATKTHSKKLIEEFRSGEAILDWSEKKPDQYHGPKDNEEALVEDENEKEDLIFMQLLESKKSKLLADILIKQKSNDISFEEFSDYEFCFEECLNNPDEVFEYKDNEGDMFFNYIKTFSRGVESFYYIVSCIKRKIPGAGEVNVYPVLALPTIDIDLCQEFRIGKRISGPVTN